MYTDSRPQLAADTARTLSARFYTDSAIFRREIALVHRRMWLYAGRATQIATAGDFFRLDVDGDSVLVWRDASGEIRAFHNLCRHRGTRLCTESAGHLPGRVQCPYHAWTYGLDGRLQQAPYMEKTVGFRKDDHPLHPVAVDEWDGHLFIHLGEDPPPLAEHLDDLPARFRPWRMEELRSVHRRVYDVRANWKLIVQNYSECLHCPVLHPQLQQLSHFMSGENAPPHPTYLGGCMELRPGVDSLTRSGKSSWCPLPGLSAEERRLVMYYAVLPNLLLNLHSDYMMTLALWPRAVNRTEIVCEWHFHPQTCDADDFDPAPAIEFWDLTNRQDWQVSELAQQGISSRAYRPGPYSNREELLHAFDDWILQRLGIEREGGEATVRIVD